MVRLAALAAWAAALTVGLAGQAEPPAGLDDMVIDGSGRIVALGRGGILAFFGNGQWTQPAVAAGGEVRGLLALRNGKVALACRIDTQGWLLTLLDGDRVAKQIPFAWPEGTSSRVSMSEDSRGGVWIGAESPVAIRVNAKSGDTRRFDLTEFNDGPPVKYWNRVAYAEDGAGKGWLWTQGRASNHGGVPLPLSVEDVERGLAEKWTGFTGHRILSLQPNGATEFLVGTWNDGLFLLDLKTKRAEPIPHPQPRALSPIREVVPFNGGCIVCLGTGSKAVVWQWRDGVWVERFKSGETTPVRWRNRIPAAEIESGLLIGVDNGVLFIPRAGGDARHLDWKSGFAMKEVVKILPLGGDRFAVLAAAGPGPQWMLTDIDSHSGNKVSDQKLPPGFQPEKLRSPQVLRDRSGITWVTGGGNLYKYCEGRTVPVFAEGNIHPFLANPQPISVRVDRANDVWFWTGRDPIRHIRLIGRTTKPPGISVEADRWGRVTLSAEAEGEIEWREGGGPWQPMQDENTFAGRFPPGRHVFEVRALSAHLDRLGPVQQAVEVTIDQEAQIAHLIQLLRGGPDPVREEAVEALSRQPEAALPALEHEFPGTDHWWANVAKQECRRAMLGTRGSP